MKLTELFNPKSIALVWEQNASNRIPYLGAGLFPVEQKAGLDLRWIKGSNGLPVSLMPTAFDAQVTFRDRPGVEITETEMPFFREGFKIKERDRQELLRIQDTNDPYVDQILNGLYNDAQNLIAGAEVVAERERMQLLFPTTGTPGIVIKGNGVDYTYNYDPSGAWYNSGSGGNYFALAGNALWTAPATSDPLNDFRTVKQFISNKTGSDTAIAIMNSYTFNLLIQSDAIKKRFLSTSGIALGYITEDQAKAVIADSTGIQIVVYDKQYRNESKVAAKFVPDGYVALIPEGPLGKTYRGITPEQADLMSGSDASVAIVENGIAITQFVEKNPVNVNTIASEIVLPSYERMDEVALLKVIS